VEGKKASWVGPWWRKEEKRKARLGWAARRKKRECRAQLGKEGEKELHLNLKFKFKWRTNNKTM
jgi:hypothetical protein